MKSVEGAGGLYVVGMTLPKERVVTVGAFGRVRFEGGLYLYVGSAKAGLGPRVARHAKRVKPKRWHIDHLRAVCRWEGAFLYPGADDECGLAVDVAVAVGGIVTPPRFGASDCRCRGHLVRTALAWAEAMERTGRIGR